MSRHPILKWAQRSDKIYLTVDLADAKDVKLKLEPDGKFIFSAVKDGCDFVVDLELFDKVNVEESKYVVGPRNISYIIIKAESNWWPRLIKQEGKTPAFLKADWDKWVDEDEENEVVGGGAPGGMDFDGMDFSKLGGMGGMGGMPGMGGMGGMGGMPDMSAMMAGMGGMGGMGGMPGMGDFSMPEGDMPDDDDEDDEEDEVKKPEAKVEEVASKSASEEAKA
ncbi:unnamed protein product [Linum tenue]|uniref:Co-chaperone protein p23 n=1 Tax=Linum tenue TaxID=586396 RepID=A0AAV0KLD0_9ROSI|nr:unnamed protein product [Linum tenue]